MNGSNLVKTALVSFVAATCLGSAGQAAAQCTGQWLAPPPFPGLTGNAQASAAMVWDPDGAGPNPEVLVVGGQGFTAAGNAAAANIAVWNGASTWSSLGLGVNGVVAALGVASNGNLLVGGSFTTVDGGMVVNNIARWDGATWSGIGVGAEGQVQCILGLPNGDIVIGGTFTQVGGFSGCIARWDGASSTWVDMGGGVGTGSSGESVNTLIRMPNGDIVAGGRFGVAGGVGANNIARWNGSTWAPMAAGLGSDVSTDRVNCLTFWNGELVAGGKFPGTGDGNIARWDGSAWQGVSGGIAGEVFCLLATGDGNLLAGGQGGYFGEYSSSLVAATNGTTWSTLGGGVNAPVKALAQFPAGKVVAGGAFYQTNGVSPEVAFGLAGWDGTAWTSLPPADNQVAVFTGSTSALSPLATGGGADVVVCAGSFFSFAPGFKQIAKWNATTHAWSAMGLGLANNANATAVMPNGDIIAGGSFLTEFGAVSPVLNRIARFDGTSWQPFGSGMSNRVDAVAIAPDGDIIAGGTFTAEVTVSGQPTTPAANRIIRWDSASSQWMPMGSGMSNSVTKLLALPNGDVIAAGGFTAAITVSGQPTTPAANRIIRWDHTTGTWVTLGTGASNGVNNTVNALALAPNGDVLVGGTFTTAGGVTVNRIARWTPATDTWSAFDVGGNIGVSGGMSSSVGSIAVLHNGAIVARGTFLNAGGLAVNRIARWDGAAWSAMGEGLSSSGSMTVLQDGRLVAGGSFTTQGQNAAMNLAVWGDCGSCCAANGTCTVVAGAPNCAGGTFMPSETSCTSNPCPQPTGVCCRGSTCNAAVQQVDCTAAAPTGAVFVAAAGACNGSGMATAPCCHADYNKSDGISVQDIFDFLSAWFQGSLLANVGGDGSSGTLTVQDIFDFLGVWFAGGC